MSDKAPNPPTGENGDGISLRFWGVRGSLPTPGPSTVRYGGNTLCVELRCGRHLVILDAGSGLREFGATLAASSASVNADVLLSHTHLDHICGLPFFAPMFDPSDEAAFLGRPSRAAGWHRGGIAKQLAGAADARSERGVSCRSPVHEFYRRRHTGIASWDGRCNDAPEPSREFDWLSYRLGWSKRLLHHRYRTSVARALTRTWSGSRPARMS